MRSIKKRAKPDRTPQGQRLKKAQDIIPVAKVFEDGIFQLDRMRFSCCWSFSDVNYQALGPEEKDTHYSSWQKILNTLPPEGDTKISVVNENIDSEKFLSEIEIRPKKANLKQWADCYNQVIRGKIDESDGIIQNRYITISCRARDVKEAGFFFRRVETGLMHGFAALGSELKRLDASERLRIFYAFFCPGMEAAYELDMTDLMRRGQHFKDYIAPASFENNLDYFRMGDKFARVLLIKNFPSFVRDTLLLELTNVNRQLMLTIDVLPIQNADAKDEIKRKILGVETEIATHSRKQIAGNNISGIIPYDLDRTQKNMTAVLEQMNAQDQRMFLIGVTMVHVADSLEQLNEDTDYLISVAVGHGFQMIKRYFTQVPDLQGVLPFGIRRFDSLRSITTAELAAFSPFRAREVQDKNGIYMGENIISRNLILIDREWLKNPSMFIFGIPGAGKSFLMKEMVIAIALKYPNDDIFICDPEGEFTATVTALGGTEIRVTASSPHRINALDLTEGYSEKDDGDPVAAKVGFVYSLFQQMTRATGGLGPAERSIIDRCVKRVFDRYETPTLVQLQEILAEQPEKAAKTLCLYLELFTKGTGSIFAQPTNVNTDARIISYNIRDLEEQLKLMGNLIITDQIRNRVARNWVKGRRTHVIVDEFHIMFSDSQAADFFKRAWRQFRKRDGWPVGITQNVRTLLSSGDAIDLVSNSELVVMLSQAAADREKLAELYKISEEQMNFVRDVPPGNGLIKYGNSILPFVNNWPKDNDLYWLMTTKPGERRGLNA